MEIFGSELNKGNHHYVAHSQHVTGRHQEIGWGGRYSNLGRNGGASDQLITNFQETEREGSLPNSFCETSTGLRQKSNTLRETHKLISLMNMDVKIINKI